MTKEFNHRMHVISTVNARNPFKNCSPSFTSFGNVKSTNLNENIVFGEDRTYIQCKSKYQYAFKFR